MDFKERTTWLKIASCPSISAKKRARIWQKLSDFNQWDIQVTEFVASFFNEDKANQIINELENAAPYTNDEVTIIFILDDEYPKLLKEIYEAPPLLFCKGDVELFHRQAVAVVGTRKMSDYGRKACMSIAKQLARQNITVVSGLANGIDTEAHLAACITNGNTIAVLGSGVENIYPKKNIQLANEISQKGLILSEYLPTEEARRWYFPERNRIISGLALGTVIIEAAERSGSLITADFALEQNRQVFAVPGSIFSDTCKGTNNLIQEGAKLVINANNIIEEFFQIKL